MALLGQEDIRTVGETLYHDLGIPKLTGIMLANSTET